jgi:hypothetical protein
VPYVIDPAVTHRDSLATTNGTAGATSITLNMPVGVAPRDLLVAQVAVRGGTDVTVTPPAGWTSAVAGHRRHAAAPVDLLPDRRRGRADDRDLHVRRDRAAAAGGRRHQRPLRPEDDLRRRHVRGGRVEGHVGKRRRVRDHDDGARLADRRRVRGRDRHRVLDAVGDERALRRAVVGHRLRRPREHRLVHRNAGGRAGSTGNKTSALTSGHWLAHLLSFRVDDVRRP